MKTRDARAISERITAGVHFPGGPGGGWADLSNDAQDSTWAPELLARMTIIVGVESIEYVSGYVEDDGEISGEIVILTSTRIIRTHFTARRLANQFRFGLQATVVATSRSMIESVTLESVSLWGEDADEEWPRAVSAVVATSDGKSFRLPVVKGRPYIAQTETAKLISTLMSN
jgi:hypothetical protein